MSALTRAVSIAVLAMAGSFGLAACADGTNDRSTSREVLLASNITAEDNGLVDVLIAAFEAATEYDIKVVSSGSSEAIDAGRSGDVDVLLVQASPADEQLVADGDGIERAAIMHNDFILVGPSEYAAGFYEEDAVAEVMRAIVDRRATFVSRGDDSGTHIAERRLWESAGIEPAEAGRYIETGTGQTATLRLADYEGAYALTDRGTFIALEESVGRAIAWEAADDPLLQNTYRLIVVNPVRHPSVNAAGARAFAAWLATEEAQRLIAAFGVDEYGEPLFFPGAPQ